MSRVNDLLKDLDHTIDMPPAAKKVIDIILKKHASAKINLMLFEICNNLTSQLVLGRSVG